MIWSGSIPSISLDRWRQNHAKSVQNHGTVIAMNEEVPLVTEPQPRLNSWTLNKGWIIIGTAWCTTIHHYSDMKPFIGHNGRNTHLVLVLLGTQQLWEKLNHQKSLDFLHLKNRDLQHGRKDALNLGKCQALSNVELNHQKKHEFDSTNLRSNLIYVVSFKSFPDARWWYTKPLVLKLQKTHFSTSNKNNCHCHQDAVRPWAPTIK